VAYLGSLPAEGDRVEDRRGAATQRSLTHGASPHQQTPVLTVARAWKVLDATVTLVACPSLQRMPDD
jgi:hypothetical protein